MADDRPNIPIVNRTEAASILHTPTADAAAAALHRAGIRSGYPRALVEWLARNRPGRGHRTDLDEQPNPKETPS
jgi:hypothetical protein